MMEYFDGKGSEYENIGSTLKAMICFTTYLTSRY